MKYFSEVVNSACFTLPQMQCPGCTQRIETNIWKRFVPPSTFVAYLANAASMLTVNCGNCETARSLFNRHLCTTTEREQITQRMCELWETHPRFCGKMQMTLKCIEYYDQGRIEADEMATQLFSCFNMPQETEKDPFETECRPSHPVIEAVANGEDGVLAALIDDLERRAVSYLIHHTLVGSPGL